MDQWRLAREGRMSAIYKVEESIHLAHYNQLSQNIGRAETLNQPTCMLRYNYSNRE